MMTDLKDAAVERLKQVALAAVDDPDDAVSILFGAWIGLLVDRFGPVDALRVMESMLKGARDGARDAGVRFRPARPKLVPDA